MDQLQRDQWLEWRRVNGFGGSDAPAVLGLSKFKSQTELVLEKRGEIPFKDDTEFFHWRREMEDPILREYGRRTGRMVVKPEHPVKSQEHPFMFTTYDGVVMGAAEPGPTVFADSLRVVQAKTANSKQGWGEPGTDEVPDDYWIQVQHEMATCGAPVADIPVLFYFSKLEIFTVEADPVFQAELIDQERKLWDMITKTSEMPPVVTIEDAVARWGRSSKLGKVVATEEVLNAVAQLKLIKLEAQDLEARNNAAKLVIINAMMENETLVDVDGQILLTWKAAKGRSGIDKKKLELEFPQAYAACFKRGDPYRTMLLKGEKS